LVNIDIFEQLALKITDFFVNFDQILRKIHSWILHSI